MCRQTIRSAATAAGTPALSCLPNRAVKVNLAPAIFCFRISWPFPFSLQMSGQSPTVERHAICIVQAGSMRSFAFSTGAVACSSSGSNRAVQAVTTLSSTRDGSRQEIADIPCFAAPPGDAHRARGSRYLLLFNRLSATAAADNSSSLTRSDHRAGFNFSR